MADGPFHVSFLIARLFPRTPEKSLEDFIINKFGKILYRLFFQALARAALSTAESRLFVTSTMERAWSLAFR